MFKVYWTTNDGASHGQEFQELVAALNHSQTMRNESAKFVTVMGEDPNCTSRQGASVMNREDYHWRKRRK